MPGRGVGSPNNPYVFVEMGPDSISVNSISAHVVSTSEETNTSSTATGKSSFHMARVLFPCSTQLSMKLNMLINVKMPTIVGILTFISMINITSENFKVFFSILVFMSS